MHKRQYLYGAILLSLVCLIGYGPVGSQTRLLDDFATISGWQIIASDGVRITTSVEHGYACNCIRIDFDFQTGAGYGGIQKRFPTILPENYQFQFFIRGDAAVNNFEFKLTDARGENVWWRNQRNYAFPARWRKETIKKRHISFAWGPTQDRELKTFDRIEFIIASSSGGKGTVYLDELILQELDPVPAVLPLPTLMASSQRSPDHPVTAMMDQTLATAWFSDPRSEEQQIQFDFGCLCEFGGLIIDWDTDDFARRYVLWSSVDGREWDKVYAVGAGTHHRAYIPLREQESRYLRLNLQKSSRGRGYGIREIKVKDVAFSESAEALYRSIAGDAQRGMYPRYLLDEQVYWTVVGAPDDDKEALISEDGSVEVDKSCFSLEPFLMIGDTLYTWADVDRRQQLAEDYLPIPTVRWTNAKFELAVTAFASGRRNHAHLWLRYAIRNRTNSRMDARFFLTIRPFQVNPPWQFLNWPGGIAPIHSISWQRDTIRVNDHKRIFSLQPPDQFATVSFEEGDIIHYVKTGRIPERSTVTDSMGFASAAMQWSLALAALSEKTIDLVIPFYDSEPEVAFSGPDAVTMEMDRICRFWREKVGAVQFQVPPEAEKLIHTLRSNLSYILINRDGVGIQPGSRSYERSWIRDGSLTSAALLRFGLQEQARAFLDWYAGYLFPDGKVPCVVDRRGPDPVPEHDSNGQFIFAIWQYYLFTGDVAFLQSHFDNVRRAVAYLDALVAQRSSDYYRMGDDSLRSLYGLVPESISHEGYSAKPMHSYWDNFFTLLGYKDAVRIARALNREEAVQTFSISRDRFQQNLYRSLQTVFDYKEIDFIPGC
ncbi:discoidin domain-containing protein, partial [candidate division KSB1 bacterium]|nr:discoidin domain-containing protein [candidate division KSB1 bacterium]